MSAEGRNTTVGKQVRARLFYGEAINLQAWFAIGTGSWIDKQSPPAETGSETALTVEYARKKVTHRAYLQQDDALGTISWRGHLYKEVTGPTAIVGYFGSFVEDEVVGVQICEEAFFVGNVTTNPPTLTLAMSGEIVTPGDMLWLRNRPAATKAAQERYTSYFIDDSSLETPS